MSSADCLRRARFCISKTREYCGGLDLGTSTAKPTKQDSTGIVTPFLGQSVKSFYGSYLRAALRLLLFDSEQ